MRQFARILETLVGVASGARESILIGISIYIDDGQYTCRQIFIIIDMPANT